MAGLLHATRPRQWTKNILVFAAPTAAGSIIHPDVVARSVVAFLVFVTASAATYLVNDVADRDNDRLHPVKKSRPVASGQLPVDLALSTAAALATVALVTAALVFGAALAGIIAAYLAVSVCYSLMLKRVPLVELACVAAGFALRAVAGGAVAHVAISPWFLMVASFGSLLIVAGKRSVEQSVMKDQGELHRSALAAYPAAFLRSVRMLAMSVTVTTYCLWAFERAGRLGPVDRRGHRVVRALDHSIRARRPRRRACDRAGSRRRAGRARSERSWAPGAGTRVARVVDLRDLRMNAASRRELLAGWGRAAASAATLVRPESVSDLEDLVAGERGILPMVARGLGRSYGDAAQCAGGQLRACGLTS